LIHESCYVSWVKYIYFSRQYNPWRFIIYFTKTDQ
jgi:hypothetical protein